MEIYNSHLLNNKQRFRKALLYGLLACIGCAMIVSYMMQITSSFANILFPILYLLNGYSIAKAINKAGGGIGKKYAYMGAILTFLSILLTDMLFLTNYAVITNPQSWLPIIQLVFKTWFHLQGTNILKLFFLAWSIYIGYSESDITNH